MEYSRPTGTRERLTGLLVLPPLVAVPDSQMPPVPPSHLTTFSQGMGRTSLTSSPQNPMTMYAVSADPRSGEIYAVLASIDGGTSWQARTIPTAPAGSQGDYNNCISVSPFDPNVVAIGWIKYFLSTDGAITWTMFDIHAPGQGALHDDVHAVYFDPSNPPVERLFICSDGGIASTTDRGKTFSSSYNQYLANLEGYTLSVRGNYVAMGLQDNGNAYFAIKTFQAGVVSPWVQVSDQLGDGGTVAIIATGQLITNDGTAAFSPRATIPIDADYFNPFDADKELPVSGVPSGGIAPIELIETPGFSSGSQAMYAVGSQARTQSVYGLFANSNGNNPQWKQVGSVASDASGDFISAVAPLSDGTSVLVGTNAGRVFLLRLLSGGSAIGQRLSASTNGQVNRIVFVSSTLAFIASNSNGQGVLFRFDGAGFIPADIGLPGTPCQAIARDGYGRTWVCTEDRVFVSRDDGFTWRNASNGLPQLPYCTDLRFNFAQPNPPLLYLGTYGNSVWVTSVIA